MCGHMSNATSAPHHVYGIPALTLQSALGGPRSALRHPRGGEGLQFAPVGAEHRRAGASNRDKLAGSVGPRAVRRRTRIDSDA